MGLKSGSRDSGLDDEDEDTEKTEDEMQAPFEESDPSRQPSAPVEDSETMSETQDQVSTPSESSRPTKSSLPYKLRRERVNEDRQQVPFFLRDRILDEEQELEKTLEDRLGENVYKSDYREAAIVVAQRHPDLVADILREWGYDLE